MDINFYSKISSISNVKSWIGITKTLEDDQAKKIANIHFGELIIECRGNLQELKEKVMLVRLETYSKSKISEKNIYKVSFHIMNLCAAIWPDESNFLSLIVENNPLYQEAGYKQIEANVEANACYCTLCNRISSAENLEEIQRIISIGTSFLKSSSSGQSEVKNLISKLTEQQESKASNANEATALAASLSSGENSVDDDQDSGENTTSGTVEMDLQLISNSSVVKDILAIEEDIKILTTELELESSGKQQDKEIVQGLEAKIQYLVHIRLGLYSLGYQLEK